MALWDWTLRAYARPGAQEACLRLQDAHGQNVPLLLWAVWAETVDGARLDAAAALARRWEASAVGPIRDIRRALKPAFAGVDDDARLGLRDDVKAVELRAERVLMEALEAMTGEHDGAPALTALEAASSAWARAGGARAPDQALAALAAALG